MPEAGAPGEPAASLPGTLGPVYRSGSRAASWRTATVLTLASAPGVCAGCGVAGDATAATEATSGSADTDGDAGLSIPPRPTPEGCDARDCGPEGSCQLRSGQAVCVCPEGQLATATGPCVPCTVHSIDEPFELDFATVELRGQVTVDGLSLLEDTVNTGTIHLVGTQDGDDSLVGSLQGGAYAAALLPGRYHVEFAAGTSAGLAPENQRVRLIDDLDLDADTELDLDLRTGAVSGVFTVDGRPRLADAERTGHLSLRDPATGGELDLGDTRDGSYAHRAVRGTYDLVYRGEQGAEDLPANSKAVLRRGVEVGATTDLDVDVPAARIEGALALTRIPPPDPLTGIPDGPPPSVRVYLRSTGELGEVALGSTAQGNYAVSLIPGEYEVWVRSERFGAGAPQNSDGPLWSAGTVRIESDQRLDVAIATARITGDLTINGAPVFDLSDAGSLSLRDVHGGAVVQLGSTSQGLYAAEVLPGRYDVLYSAQQPGALAPLGTDVIVLEDVEITGDMRLDIDVPSVRVTGDFDLGGGADGPGPGPGDQSRAALRDPTTGYDAVLGELDDGIYSVNVVPGFYDLVFRGNGASSIAINRAAVLRSALRFKDNRALDVRVRPATLEYRFTLDGAPVTSLAGFNVYLRNDATGDQASLGFTLDTPKTAPLLPGTYFVDLEVSNPTSPVINRSGRVGCWWITDE